MCNRTTAKETRNRNCKLHLNFNIRFSCEMKLTHMHTKSTIDIPYSAFRILIFK